MEKRVLSSVVALSLLLCILLSGCNQTPYTVNFDGNYPGSVEYPSATVNHGKKVTPPADPVREGYVFLGWYADAGLTQRWDMEKDKVQSDVTLYAGWDKDTGDNFVYLSLIFQTCSIQKVLLNGALAYKLFVEKYAGIAIPYKKMQSTSPANPRYTQEEWWRELSELY